MVLQMRQDNSYIRNLLIKLEEIEGIDFNIQLLADNGIDINDQKFIMHFRLICDQDLVVPAGKTDYGFGYDGKNNFSWQCVVPLRISSRGHEFLAAVRKSEVWEKIKSDFTDASISQVIDAGLKLGDAWLKKKVTSLIDSGAP
jgi:hypothetical protein